VYVGGCLALIGLGALMRILMPESADPSPETGRQSTA